MAQGQRRPGGTQYWLTFPAGSVKRNTAFVLTQHFRHQMGGVFPTPTDSPPPPGFQQFNSVLTLPAWRQHQNSPAEGSVP